MLDILSSNHARAGLKRGMQVTADAVAAALGPCGRSVVVGDPGAPLRVARTGLAVAMSMHFEDRAETSGAALLRQVAQWAQEAAGDGTASAVAVAHLLARESVNLVDVGVDPMALRRGIDAALAEADRHIALLARPAGAASLGHVASTAAADGAIGDLVAEAAGRSGGHNLVVVEEGACAGAGVEVVNGIAVGAGYALPELLTLAGRQRERCRLHRPLVLILRGSLAPPETLHPAIEHARGAHRPLLMLAEEVPAYTVAAVLRRAHAASVKVLMVELPRCSPGSAGSETLIESLAALTGATVLGAVGGVMPVALTSQHLGEASTVLADAERTIVVRTGSRRQSGGIAVVRVPGRGSAEGDVPRVRAERAARAVHGAATQGVVPGGGVALLKVAAALAEVGSAATDRETRLGFSVVQRALEEPFRQLAQNAAIAPARAIRRVERRDDLDFAGLSLPSGEVVDLAAAGILDPVPVLHGVLHAAACAVRLLLATETAAARGRDADPYWTEIPYVG